MFHVSRQLLGSLICIAFGILALTQADRLVRKDGDAEQILQRERMAREASLSLICAGVLLLLKAFLLPT
jgi:hypothetical protein